MKPMNLFRSCGIYTFEGQRIRSARLDKPPPEYCEKGNDFV
jgi:hypothetical protein